MVVAAERFDEITSSVSLAGTREDPEVTTKWRGRGYANSLDVYTAFLLNTPYIFNHPGGYTLYRQIPPKIDEIAYRVWDVGVQYGRRRQEGDWNFNCQTSGGTLRIKQSRELISKHATDGAVAPGTIGEPFRIKQNGDNVEGTDIVIPTTRFSFSFSHPQGEVTVAYCKGIADRVGEVNSTSWGLFAEATALLIGFNASDGREQPASVSYEILYSKGVQGKTIRDMAGIDKDGHHFLDVTYEDAVEGGEAVKEPRFVHIHRIYEESDFADFLPFTPS